VASLGGAGSATSTDEHQADLVAAHSTLTGEHLAAYVGT
jgi:hypothetical protein